MWQSTASEDNPQAGAGAPFDADADRVRDPSDLEAERWPQDETVLGLLLRLPATWIR